jgi:hypothetical protein
LEVKDIGDDVKQSNTSISAPKHRIGQDVREDYKAYNRRKANTNPMKPDTSTNEKPMKLQRINVLLKTGLREIDSNKKLKISPTPTPTPARDIRGILDAKYLNPNNIIFEGLSDQIHSYTQGQKLGRGRGTALHLISHMPRSFTLFQSITTT